VETKPENCLRRFLPGTRREWLRFAFDIILLIFFIYFIYNTSYAYGEGFKSAATQCEMLWNRTNTPMTLP
jgi:TRAP-type C4-dicarboxylate transport system permease small subunit